MMIFCFRHINADGDHCRRSILGLKLERMNKKYEMATTRNLMYVLIILKEKNYSYRRLKLIPCHLDARHQEMGDVQKLLPAI
jgi:hypothetical protein